MKKEINNDGRFLSKGYFLYRVSLTVTFLHRVSLRAVFFTLSLSKGGT